jgi:DNA-binding NtrC family response regulator
MSADVANILIVDDDLETCRFMAELLSRGDRHIESAHEPETARCKAGGQGWDLLISDLNLNAGISGLDLLRTFKQANPQGEVLLISGFGTLETAIDAVRAGAFDYISKPFDITEVKATVERALLQALRPPEDAAAPPPPVRTAAGLIGRSPGMLAVYKQIARAADSSVPVLIVGESGTGKELVARAVHAHSPRAHRSFLPVNCGAITETLLESELFGHARGAFTGAVADVKGLFEQAHGGTIFLDEIGETSPSLQVKLLRVLEEGEVRPVGASRPIRVDSRVVAATNADLERAVAGGRFRADLYYRLGVIVVRMPPLRERRDDIPLLAAQFLENACGRARRRVTITPEALDAMLSYSWPGNVRELENTIERLVLFSRGSGIEPADLPASMRERVSTVEQQIFQDLPTLDEMQRRYLLHALAAVGGNRSRTAELLHIDRRTLYRMAERFGIDFKEEPRDE